MLGLKNGLSDGHEENKKLRSIINEIKVRYLELFLSSKNDWRKRVPKALELFDWLKDVLPLTDEEKIQVSENKDSKEANILTQEEKKKRSRWFKWRKDI